MIDEHVIGELRQLGRTLSASALLLKLGGMLPNGLTQGSMVTFLKRAFPEIPLPTLAVERSATPSLARLGGRLDGRSAKELVYTVPVSAGFVAIEGVLNGLNDRFPDYEWFYGNVYDPKDGETPLNWWKDSQSE